MGDDGRDTCELGRHRPVTNSASAVAGGEACVGVFRVLSTEVVIPLPINEIVTPSVLPHPLQAAPHIGQDPIIGQDPNLPVPSSPAII